MSEKKADTGRKEQALLTQIIENAPIRVFWKDLEGRYLGCNALFAKDAGWASPEALIGKSDFDMSWKAQVEQYRADDKAVTDSDTPKIGYEEAQTTPDGKTIWLRTSKVPLHDPDTGVVIGMLGIYDDITRQKQVEEAIRHMNEELESKVRERTAALLAAQDELLRNEKLAVLGQVAGSVGHELRNPLGVMNNAVYYLQTVLVDADATTREYLDMIRDEIGSAERIVADLLDSVRTKSPQCQGVAVSALVERVRSGLPMPEAIAFKVALEPGLPPLWVDPHQIQQVLRNLLSNAIDAMPDGGTLEFWAGFDAAAHTVILEVRDTGAGIAPENIRKLFQPLYTTKPRGIGLGLVVVKNLVQVNGGRVAVQSTPGEGSTFSVTLPAAAPESQTEEAGSAT